ncbi:MAG: hypothetical protein ACREJ7_01575 [Candidatus Methylomirabilales bacterium]
MTVRLLAILGLVLAFSAGRLAAAGRLDAGAHTALALLAGGLSIAGHVRSGTGLDLSATVLLVLAMGLGVFVSGGAVLSHLHLAVAGAAVVLSGSMHVVHLWERVHT